MEKQLQATPKIGLSGNWLIESAGYKKKLDLKTNPESDIFIWHCEICGIECGGNRTESKRRCKSCQEVKIN